MDEVFLVCFFTGLFFTVATFFMAHAFGGHEHDLGGHDADLGGVEAGDVDVGDADASHEIDLGHDFEHSVAEAGGGGHVEVGVTDSFPGLSPWSPTVLSSFVTSFGGIGYIARRPGELGVPFSVLVAVAGGGAIAAGVFYGMNRLFRALQASSEVHVADLRGRPAEVITPIPEDGVGEISYVAGGTRLSAPARTVDGRPLGRAARVRIVRIAGTTYYVEPC